MNFEVENRNGFGIVHCHVDLTTQVADELYTVLNRLVKDSVGESDYTILLDLRHQMAIDAQVAIGLVKISDALKKAKRSIMLLHAPMAVLNQVGRQLAVAESEELFARPAPAASALDREALLIEALRYGIQQTCLTLCPTLAVKAEAPFIKGKRLEIQSDIAAALSVKGTSIEGTIVLTFPKQIYLAVLGEMHGSSYQEIGPELQDGASELLNMIRSLARGKAKGYIIGKEIPEVSSGSVLQNSLEGFQTTIVMPFSAMGSQFHCLIGHSPHS